MPPIDGSSMRFSAVTSQVCTVPSGATNRSATDRAAAPDGSAHTSSNHAAASSRSPGATRDNGGPSSSLGYPRNSSPHGGAYTIAPVVSTTHARSVERAIRFANRTLSCSNAWRATTSEVTSCATTATMSRSTVTTLTLRHAVPRSGRTWRSSACTGAPVVSAFSYSARYGEWSVIGSSVERRAPTMSPFVAA